MAIHSAITSAAEIHQDKLIASSLGAADVGKVTTPTTTAGTGELRKLLVAELSDGASVATLTSVQTLSGKTLTLPEVNNVALTFQYQIAGAAIIADRVVTLPLLTGNDVFVTEAFIQTLTNKTVNLTSNTLTGTTAQFNTALSDGDFATLAGVETLTNKRITERVSTVAYAANIGVNADSFDQLQCNSLTGNVIVDAPTGTHTEGQHLIVSLTQDGAGARTITYNAAFVTTGATVTTLSTTETREFVWHVARAQWIQLAFTSGI